MELELTGEDREFLSEVLERRLRELQKEISHTDHRDYKALLRGNEKRIESMLGRLRMSAIARVS
ncbi:MAG TPA: hypothetical protein VFE61_29735 [Candidatus Sulfotelmatobacter sp.]|jgi:hypothetical protein|nr:hypothetical protein [Candidatus Sulfotelmatobacter sp.]